MPSRGTEKGWAEMDLFGLVCQHIIEYPFKKTKTLEYI